MTGRGGACDRGTVSAGGLYLQVLNVSVGEAMLDDT